MKCLYCGCLESKVVDSRPSEDGHSIRRRRECVKCAKRFTTYEKIEELPLIIVKKDGRRENFEREKVFMGIQKSCEKLPIAIDDIEKLVDEVVKEAYNSLAREISTKQIGDMVMKRLKFLDEVAYVRFASIYRSFTDINSFMDELRDLIDNKNGKNNE